MTPTERFDVLDKALCDGLVTRGTWRDTDAHGRHLACLLATLAPECGETKDPSTCPASVLRPWLAHLTPWIDDAGSPEAWSGQVRRYAGVIRRVAALDKAADRRLEYRVRTLCVGEAMRHTSDPQTLAACKTVAVLCERVVAGDEPTMDEWTMAAKSAESAAKSAVWSAESAAWSAAAAARSAAESAAKSAVWSAESAAWSAAAAARSAAADRLIDAILGAMEAAVQL
jgi:hypothetical protein